MFHKSLDRGEAGDNMGVLVRGLKREDVLKGMVAAKVGTVTQHTRFEAQMYVLSKEEGGRHTPFVDGYMPQLFTRTGDISAKIELADGKMVMPGEDASFTVELINPLAIEVRPVPLLRFARLPHTPMLSSCCRHVSKKRIRTHVYWEYWTLQEGQRFTVREGSKTVGTGVISKILA